MPQNTTAFLLNQMLQNFQVRLKDAGSKLCDQSWGSPDSYFLYDSIGFVKEGEIFMRINGKSERIRTGGLYYIPAMTCYTHHVMEASATVYWTHFELGTAGTPVAERLEFPVCVYPALPQTTQALFENLFASQCSGALGAPFETTGLMYRLVAHFFEECGESVELRSTGKYEKMKQVAEYIEKNLHESLTVDLLAAQVGLNPNYFIRAFRQFFHETPIRFVLTRREQDARALLENSGMSVKQIGLSLGFSNQNYFSEFFKKRSGYSPSEYRELKAR